MMLPSPCDRLIGQAEVLWRPAALFRLRMRSFATPKAPSSGYSRDKRSRSHCRPAAAASTQPPLPPGVAIHARGLDLSFPARSGSSFLAPQQSQRQGKRVLAGADLDVRRGSFHMLLGANGCGKSTLLRVLGGLLTPAAGSLAMDAPSAFVFQNPDHQVVMPTVAADVAFGLGRYELPAEAVHAAVEHALAQVGLLDCAERPTSTLSGGQKQRVAIAGALAQSPRVLLLDELTTFLDYEDQLNVLRCVRRIVDGGRPRSPSPSPSDSIEIDSSSSGRSRSADGGQQQQQQLLLQEQDESEEGVTALWVTHRLEELDYADAVSVMEGGRIVLTGSPAEARAHLKALGATL